MNNRNVSISGSFCDLVTFEFACRLCRISLLSPSAASPLKFRISRFGETGICFGDVWSVGDAEVQVAQPRQPCWKLARRWGIKNLARRVQETGKTGWYFRAIKQGDVSAGMDLKLIDRLNPKWTIAAANQIMHHDTKNLPAALELAAVAELSPNWKQTLTNRVILNVEPNTQARLAPQTGRD